MELQAPFFIGFFRKHDRILFYFYSYNYFLSTTKRRTSLSFKIGFYSPYVSDLFCMKLLLTTVDLNFNLECFLVILLLMKPFFRTLQSICGFPFSVGHILIIMDSLYNSHFHSYIYDFFILEKSLAFMNIQKKQFHQI